MMFLYLVSGLQKTVFYEKRPSNHPLLVVCTFGVEFDQEVPSKASGRVTENPTSTKPTIV